jgi:hypothetical protein
MSPLTLLVTNCQPAAGAAVADGTVKSNTSPWFSPIQSFPLSG